jgi:hypothetical protein
MAVYFHRTYRLRNYLADQKYYVEDVQSVLKIREYDLAEGGATARAVKESAESPSSGPSGPDSFQRYFVCSIRRGLRCELSEIDIMGTIYRKQWLLQSHWGLGLIGAHVAIARTGNIADDSSVDRYFQPKDMGL